MFGLSALATKAIVAAVIVLVIFGAGFGAGHHWEAVALERLKAQYATDKAAAIEAVRAQEQVWASEARDAAVKDENNQSKIVATTKAQLQDAERNVKAARARGCITYSLLRMHDAAVLGRTPDSLPLPAGKSADACAPVDAVAVVKGIIANYGIAWQNAAQLNALTGLLRDQMAAKR